MRALEEARAAVRPARPAQAAAQVREDQTEPVIEGVMVDAATARKRTRDKSYRATPDAIMFRMMNGS